MMVHTLARYPVLVPFAVCASLLVALPVRGQAPPAQKGEIQAVVRISKQLIEDVAARQEITAALPFQEKVLGFRCQGVIDGRAKLKVDINTAQGDATFTITSQGTAGTYVRGVRGPIVALGPAWGPFTSRTLVRFEGRKFTVLETTPWAEVHGELDRVEGRHGRRVGRAVGHFLRPVGQVLVPHAEARALPIGEDILTNFVNDLAERIVTRLDRLTRVEKSLHRVFPQTTDWGFQMSSDSRWLQAAYGPRGSTVPVLPVNPGRLEEDRLEVWLHSTTKEAQALEKLTKVPLAKALVQKYIESILPQLAALAEKRSVNAVGSWIVISIGKPKVDISITIPDAARTLRRLLPDTE
jgi:hypothetical protein